MELHLSWDQRFDNQFLTEPTHPEYCLSSCAYHHPTSVSAAIQQCITCRVLGGLLSAHLLLTDSDQPFGDLSIPDYDNELLSLAHNLGSRLLPAFEGTQTGIPYPRVSSSLLLSMMVFRSWLDIHRAWETMVRLISHSRSWLSNSTLLRYLLMYCFIYYILYTICYLLYIISYLYLMGSCFISMILSVLLSRLSIVTMGRLPLHVYQVFVWSYPLLPLRYTLKLDNSNCRGPPKRFELWVMLSLCFNHVATVAGPFRSSVFHFPAKLSKVCEIFFSC